MPTKMIAISDLCKVYARYAKPHHRLQSKKTGDFHHALRDINFSVCRGETVAIIGRNGSGKSTLLQIIAGILSPTSGTVAVNGKVAALLELGAGFDPAFTGRENARLSATLYGLGREDLEGSFAEIERFADIGDYLDEPVKTYSSGMYARLGFAVAINVKPDVLIVDEALAVGDEAFQRKCYAKLRELQSQGVTILFVSHSAGTVAEICDRAILLDKGELLIEAVPKIAVSMYQRLLYAPLEKWSEVRESIKALYTNNEYTTVKTLVNDETVAESQQKKIYQPPHDESFDVAMVPETTIKYVENGVSIENVCIESVTGRRVNLLVHGEAYTYKYRVEFSRPVNSLSFGMLFKTISGVEIGGASFPALGEKLFSASGGDVMELSFEFRCLLNPGTYFTNAGVLSMDAETPQYLARIVDGLMFKVLPESELVATALVDFDVKVKATII